MLDAPDHTALRTCVQNGGEDPEECAHIEGGLSMFVVRQAIERL